MPNCCGQELAGLDIVSIDAEKVACEFAIAVLEAGEKLAIDGEQATRAGLARIDTSGDYFRLMTGGRYAKLLIDDEGGVRVLPAQPAQGSTIGISGLNEGTADDERAAQMFRALEKFAVAGQVLVFTHHHHHLLDIASAAVSDGALRLHRLEGGVAGRAPQTKKI